ncbi:MAG: 3-phosphoshikimate 1-carboxyvinyltransferase [Planctomycetes bacterium]|nr:3-phosphoshikimate 1-carboxyvinyltransferase [Planctomycetota bacterium]
MVAMTTAQQSDSVSIIPAPRPFRGEVTPPGSKSETNRFLVLAALSEGRTRLESPLRADDTNRFIDALRASGTPVTEGSSWIELEGSRRLAGGSSVTLGDGGTPTRFMIALATLARKPVIIDGSARMRERPVAEGIDMLRALGAQIEYVEAAGRLPVRVGGGKLPRGGALEVGRTASSQFVSAALLLAPRLERGVDLFVRSDSLTSPSYVELTIHALMKWGVPVQVQRDGAGKLTRITVPPTDLRASSMSVEVDASSAAYFLAAAAIVPDARVLIRGLPRLSKQPDVACLAALVSMGASESSSAAGIGVEGTSTWRGIDIDASRWPDGALCLAAIASIAKGTTRIRGLETLKVKESDRVHVMAEELARTGCGIESTDHSITIHPDRARASPVLIDPRGDHRVAMSFAVLGLARPGISIANPTCVSKSYPAFWRDLHQLTGCVS